MYPVQPELLLQLAKERQEEFIHEADQERLATMSRAGHREPAHRRWSRLLGDVRGALGGRLAALRASLPSRSSGPNEPCCDSAAG
jgi:hypothetical protein